MSLSSEHESKPVNHSSVCRAHERIFSGQEKNIPYHVLSTLRYHFPNHHVTRVDLDDCDLLEFANAGHAEAELLDAVDSERVYIPARPLAVADPESEAANDLMSWFRGLQNKSKRTEDGDKGDRLAADVRFGLYAYRWNDMEFLIYRFYFQKQYNPPVSKYFILYPRESESHDEVHCAQSDELILAVARWQSAVHDEIYVFDDGSWYKSKSLWRSVRDASWDDVILDPRTKDALMDDVQSFFDSRALYAEFAVPWKRGVILHGVPGNGKTLSIKALMSQLYASSSAATSGGSSSSPQRHRPIPSLYVKSLQNCQGPQYAIRSIFKKARKCAPCMLVFEDLDSLVTKKVRSYFLNEVDGLEDNNGILMIGSTNHLGALDPAIASRPSRFDRKYHFAIPQRTERVAYAKFWQRKLEGNTKVEFSEPACELVAEWTAGFSFAYLKELFISVLLTTARGAGRGVKDAESDGSPTRDKNYVVINDADAASAGSLSDQGKQATPPSTEESEAKREPIIKIPEMIIPEELKDNVLLQAVRQQVVALLREMDDSKTASEEKKEKSNDHDDDHDDDDEKECC